MAMPPALASALLDVLALRREQALRWRWPEVPEWVFCSEPAHIAGKAQGERVGGGGTIDEHNLERAWRRVRRRAQKAGVPSLKLHCTRHTYASLALASGKSVRWVAEQLGHASAELTLRVYAPRSARRRPTYRSSNSAAPNGTPAALDSMPLPGSRHRSVQHREKTRE